MKRAALALVLVGALVPAAATPATFKVLTDKELVAFAHALRARTVPLDRTDEIIGIHRGYNVRLVTYVSGDDMEIGNYGLHYDAKPGKECSAIGGRSVWAITGGTVAIGIEHVCVPRVLYAGRLFDGSYDFHPGR